VTVGENLDTELLPSGAGDLLRGHAGARVLVCYHRDGVRHVPLVPGSSWVIGREPPAEVQIADGSLSRQHARLSVSPQGEVGIEDLGSTNGTLINGVRVDRGAVGPTDVVTLGAVSLALHLAVGPTERLVALQGHDRFLARLAEEVVRAGVFHRGFALIMLCAPPGSGAHVSRWLGTLLSRLRRVDQVGLYAAYCVEVLLPEMGRDEAQTLATALLTDLARLEPRVGVTVFPDDGASVGELMERCRQRLTGEPASQERIVGRKAVGPAMEAVQALADRVAGSTASVLILGETGVGKEVLARRIHAGSVRPRGPFCAVNCGAIVPQLVESTLFGHEQGAFTGATIRQQGLFEAAHGGTLLLDEIGELPPAAQVSLLRTLDTRRICRVGSTREIAVDVRVIAATHRDLEAMVARESFRQDLYYRLNTVVLQIPPLRERREEIAPLAERFIEDAANGAGSRTGEPPRMDPGALGLLETHSWPGNLRELRNVIERAVVLCEDGLITVDDLPSTMRRPDGAGAAGPGAELPATGDLDFKELVQQYELRLILEALRQASWNQSEAARRLRIPRRTLVHKMRTLGIRKLGFGQDSP